MQFFYVMPWDTQNSKSHLYVEESQSFSFFFFSLCWVPLFQILWIPSTFNIFDLFPGHNDTLFLCVCVGPGNI